MEKLEVIKNAFKDVLNQIDEDSAYEIATSFERNEKVDYEDMKDKAFYMSCLIVHIHYELREKIEFLENLMKYSK